LGVKIKAKVTQSQGEQDGFLAYLGHNLVLVIAALAVLAAFIAFYIVFRKMYRERKVSLYEDKTE
jgi:hypothetical protein